MRFPSFLSEGGRVGFAAPSFGCTIEPYRSAFQNSLRNWHNEGYHTVLGPNCYKEDGIGISSTPENCGAEIMEAFCDETSPLYAADALISCGGGELMCGILPHIDFERLKEAPPKWFLGYSDNTNLIFPLALLCDTAAIYGPCAPAFGTEPRHEAIQMAEDVLTGKRLEFKGFEKFELESLKTEENPLVSYNTTEPSLKRMFIGNKEVSELSVSGRLLGGCLDCLQLHCGTKYDKVSEFSEKYKKDGILWFLEACDLNPLSVYRALWQLDEAGWFEGASGFLIGRPMHYGEEIMGLTQCDAVLKILGKYGLPILMDADIGHLPPAIPIVSGSIGHVQAGDGNWSLKMELK